jgi:NADPH:quinone reductase
MPGRAAHHGTARLDPRGSNVSKLQTRVAAEITTTFGSNYTSEISLTEALEPDVIRAYQRRATGEKYLIVPAEN